MVSIKDLFQSADWKKEKHVPVIEAKTTVKKSEPLKVTVSVGKEIPHPNSSEHHIAWIALYFLPTGEKFPYEVGRFEFNSHGASTQGPNTSDLYTEAVVTCGLKTSKSGTLIASSYCNIHGLWESYRELTVE
jgi:superoxide reductase